MKTQRGDAAAPAHIVPVAGPAPSRRPQMHAGPFRHAILPLLAATGCALAAPSPAQPPPNAPERNIFFDRPSAGDRPGEVQPPPRPDWIRPAPVLSPAEALKSFRLPPGYRIELVASEPLVEDPIALDFDPDGRLWVVEMPGYMRDVEATGRLEPVGRIVVLEDTDGDGRADRRRIYLDGLVLPRAVKVLSDGVLVAEPPHVWFTRDRDGDGRADEKIPIVTDYGLREANPSRGPNGLVWGLDNWLHSAMYGGRLRRRGGEWVNERVPVLGDWGIAQDDYGMIFLNGSSGPLRANPVASHYQERNPHLGNLAGVYEVIVADEEQALWPVRPTPGVNRGYMPGVLRDDGTLASYTACGGMTIYRGDRLPDELRGSHFLPEPAANLVKRSVVRDRPDGTVTAANPYERQDFLASTDERFRPVNTATAPDGTLYVIDLYRGLFENHTFVTTYLKRQVYERNLDGPHGLGRIYRITHESMRPGPAPRMSGMTDEQLAASLHHRNGWWRDTAQRLLVERGGHAVAETLRRMATTAAWDVTRLHALWTLEGMGQLTARDVEAGLRDESAKVRASSARLAEPWLREGRTPGLAAAVSRLTMDSAAEARRQAALSLGELPAAAKDEAALATLVHRHAEQPYVIDAVVSGLPGRELEFLERLVGDAAGREPRSGEPAVWERLAAAVFQEGEPVRIHRLLERSTGLPAWQRVAILGSVPRPVMVKGKVTVPATLLDSTDARTRELAANVSERLNWTGKSGLAGSGGAGMSAMQKLLFNQGKADYRFNCQPCHQENGQGMVGLAPPLAGAALVLGPAEPVAQVVLFGRLTGTSVMPPWHNVLNDVQVAALLTYIRAEWGNAAPLVLADAVEKVRKAGVTP